MLRSTSSVSRVSEYFSIPDRTSTPQVLKCSFFKREYGSSARIPLSYSDFYSQFENDMKNRNSNTSYFADTNENGILNGLFDYLSNFGRVMPLPKFCKFIRENPGLSLKTAFFSSTLVAVSSFAARSGGRLALSELTIAFLSAMGIRVSVRVAAMIAGISAGGMALLSVYMLYQFGKELHGKWVEYASSTPLILVGDDNGMVSIHMAFNDDDLNKINAHLVEEGIIEDRRSSVASSDISSNDYVNVESNNGILLNPSNTTVHDNSRMQVDGSEELLVRSFDSWTGVQGGNGVSAISCTEESLSLSSDPLLPSLPLPQSVDTAPIVSESVIHVYKPDLHYSMMEILDWIRDETGNRYNPSYNEVMPVFEQFDLSKRKTLNFFVEKYFRENPSSV